MDARLGWRPLFRPVAFLCGLALLFQPAPAVALRPESGLESSSARSGLEDALLSESAEVTQTGLESKRVAISDQEQRDALAAWRKQASRITHDDARLWRDARAPSNVLSPKTVWAPGGETVGLPIGLDIGRALKIPSGNTTRAYRILAALRQAAGDPEETFYLPILPRSGEDPGAERMLQTWINAYNEAHAPPIPYTGVQLFLAYGYGVEMRMAGFSRVGLGYKLVPGRSALQPIGSVSDREWLDAFIQNSPMTEETLRDQIAALNKLFEFVGGIPPIKIYWPDQNAPSQPDPTAGLEEKAALAEQLRNRLADLLPAPEGRPFVIVVGELARNPVVQAFVGLEANAFAYTGENGAEIVTRLMERDIRSTQLLGGLEAAGTLPGQLAFAGIDAIPIPLTGTTAAAVVQQILERFGLSQKVLSAEIPALMAGLESLASA